MKTAISLCVWDNSRWMLELMNDEELLFQEMENRGYKKSQALRLCSGGAYQPDDEQQYGSMHCLPNSCAIHLESQVVKTESTTFGELKNGEYFFCSLDNPKDAVSNFWFKDTRNFGALRKLFRSFNCAITSERVKMDKDFPVEKIVTKLDIRK